MGARQYIPKELVNVRQLDNVYVINQFQTIRVPLKMGFKQTQRHAYVEKSSVVLANTAPRILVAIRLLRVLT